MADENPTVVLFEGIVVVNVDGVHRDAYMVAKVQGIGHIVRWYGTISWLGKPENFQAGGFFDTILSDGREAKIRIPIGVEEDGKLAFLGVGLPPGFEWFSADSQVVAELRSTTPSRWRVWSARLLNLAALTCVMASVWQNHDQWKYFVTGIVLWAVAGLLVIPARGRAQSAAQRGKEAAEHDFPNASA